MNHGVRQSVVAPLALVVFCAAVAHARLPGEYLNTIRPDRFVTVCRPFAGDYARGPIKALFFVHGRIAPREVVELKQRFSMNIDAVVYDGPPGRLDLLAYDSDVYSGSVEGTSTDERMDRLYRLLEQKWDVFVFGANVGYNGLTPKAQYGILKQVSEGAGLVTLSDIAPEARAKPAGEPAGQILAGVPFPLLKSYSAMTQLPLEQLPGETLKTFTFGKGRVAVFNHYRMAWPNSLEGYWPGYHSLTPAFPYTFKEGVYYDYYLSAIAKTMVWAAPEKKSGIVASTNNTMAGTVNWAELPRPVSCGAFAIPKGMRFDCTMEIRDLFGGVTTLPSAKVAAGTFDLVVPVPPLPAGDYFIDYRFCSSKGTEYWGSYGLTVTKPPDGIQSISCAKSCFERSDRFQAGITLTAPPPAGAILRVEGFDFAGRQVFQQQLAASSGTNLVEAELSRCLVMPHHVRVELWGSQRCLDVARQDFLVARPEPAFPNIMWGDSIGTIVGEIQTAQLRKAGFNVSLACSSESAAKRDMLLMDNLLSVRFPLPVAASATNAPDVGFCNADWFKQYNTNNILPQVIANRHVPVYCYSLGDENYYSYAVGPMIAPSELRAFQQYVRDAYTNDIGSLNQEWGTSYRRFDEVPAPDVDRSMGIPDIPRKNLWMNFCEKLYADAHHMVTAEIKKQDPKARVGAEGSPPGNLELMLDGLGMWGPYPNRLDNALMRSFGQPDLLRGNWWGGYSDQRPARDQPYWDQILSGGVNSCFYYCIDGSLGMLSTDMSFADYFEKEQYPAMKEVTDGLGPLLNRTPVARMGVGIFYSLPSEHAVTIDTRFGTPGSCRDGLLKFCEENGVSAFFYSESQILSGKLDADRVQLLFLPQALCISDAAAEALKKWAAGGGVLVADQQTGVRNERGGLRSEPVLANLFAIRQEPLGQPVTTNFSGRFGGVPVRFDPVILDRGVTFAQPSTALASAFVDGIPLLVTNRVGEGCTVFLNLSLGKVLANDTGDGGSRALLLSLANQAGVFTKTVVPPGYLVTRFQGDGYELVSCRIGSGAKPGEPLRLGRISHVYDVRRGTYMGRIDELTPSKCAGRNNLFALLPASVARLNVRFPRTVKPGDLAELTVASDVRDARCCVPDRLFRIRVLGPDKEEIESMRCFTSGKDAPVTVRLPFALNQAAGIYALEVTDILTGSRYPVRFTVKGGQP